MLAPRNKLWSTPEAVIDAVINEMKITSDDIVYDIGAGDARFITMCALRTGAKCIGIEINESRARAAEILIQSLDLCKLCSIICANALECDYSNATAIFLYLVPRGLRLILPHITEIPHNVKIASYMAPLPATSHEKLVKYPVQVGKHSAEYPVYFYTLKKSLLLSDCTVSVAAGFNSRRGIEEVPNETESETINDSNSCAEREEDMFVSYSDKEEKLSVICENTV